MRLPPLLSFAVLTSALMANPVITEFMASNSESLLDGYGASSDWVEIHNPDAEELDLTGWGLRDSQETWLFPADTKIAAGGYLLVFASGQEDENHVDPAGYLHTTFKLDASGEILSLVRPNGEIAFSYDPVPRQREDIAYGLLTETSELLTPESAARYLIPDLSLPSTWRDPDFVDANWTPGRAAPGYKTSPGSVLGGGSGRHTAYLVEEGTPGNQSYAGSLGMDFEVLEEIRVTHLGVFDDRSNGLSRTISTSLWLRNGNTGIRILEDEQFTAASPGTLERGNRFKPLSTPLVLAPGSYTIVAWGYGNGELNGNQGVGRLDGLDIDPGDGLVQFVGNSRFGNAGSFPRNLDAGPSNRYAAGTFKYSPNTANDIQTDVLNEMHEINSSICLRIPFDLSNPETIDTLLLTMGYDDGFRAWINGVEVANRNAPENIRFDSPALTSGNATEEFSVVLPPGVLRESNNILAIQGLNVSPDDEDFVIVPRLQAIRHDRESARYFTKPTPGSPNDPSGIVGFVADTKFSVDRGFYERPINVEITSATPDVQIRYTIDGTTPTASRGAVYSGPIRVARTTVLRAAAFKSDFQSTNVDTHSYLFLSQVAAQGNPAGYPTTWGGISADYGMDSNIRDYARAAGDSGFSRGEARVAIAESLRAIPSISIVTDRSNLFDARTGIYLNPSGRGEQWERPVSVEVIGEDGIGKYQTNAGLRIMGFTSRNLNTTPKLNMRLLFKKQYGDAQMEYPILGSEGPNRFNTIALRGNIRDAWVAEHQGFGSASYIGDEWAKRTQFDMGQPAVRGTYAHVYLNGIYWGLYNPTERPDDAFAETYFGGNKDEYDVVKFCCPDRSTAGSITTWDRLLQSARSGLASNSSYQRIQGNFSDGRRNPALPVLIDIDNFIDYVINGQYHAQLDWPGNYYVIRDQVPERSEGFKFLTWDNDIPFGGGNPASGNKVQTSPGHNWWTESPGEIEIPLRQNTEYRMRFADRVYQHYHHDGALTAEKNIARWNKLATRIRPALFAESARWGDAKGQSLRTVQDHWDRQNRKMVDVYFPNRKNTVLSQLRSHRLYPNLAAPEFNQRGGVVSPEFAVLFSAPTNVYYTTDGSDPRRTGGSVSPSATIYRSNNDRLLLQNSTHLRARAYNGSEWSPLNEATFIVGIPPTQHNLVVSEIMYNPGPDNTAGEFLEIMNVSSTDGIDLTNVSFSDGIEFQFPLGFTLAPGERAIVVEDASAFAAVHPNLTIAGSYTGALRNGGERLAIRNSAGEEILAFTFDNKLPWPESPDGGGSSLVLINPRSIPDHNLPQNWRASAGAGGTPNQSGGTPYQNGNLLDYAVVGPPTFDREAVTVAFTLRPGADDVIVIPEWSTDLISWNQNGFEFLGGTPRQWKIVDPPEGPHFFVRYRVLLGEAE